MKKDKFKHKKNVLPHEPPLIPEILPKNNDDGDNVCVAKNVENVQQIKNKNSKKPNKKEQKTLSLNEIESAKILEIAQKQEKSDRWFKLDNAALIYPAINPKVSDAVFRISVLLKEPVDPIVLQQAVNDIVKRFPVLTASLRTGLFWYYFDAPIRPLVVKKASDVSCQPFNVNRKTHLVRVTYFSHEVGVEFFHSICDGTGALLFLNTLLSRYLLLKGFQINDTTNCLNVLDNPHEEEIEDAFQRVYVKGAKKIIKEEKAYHLKGTPINSSRIIHRKIICKSSQVVSVAKSLNCSVTVLLCALLLQAIAKEKAFRSNNDVRPISLSIPMNVRKIYPSKTIRNFSSYFTAKYTPTNSLQELIDNLKEQWAIQNTKEYVDGMIAFNCASQRNFFIKIAPVWLKNFVLSIAYKNLGYNLYTFGLSNLGNIQAPAEFKDHVLRYEFAFGKEFATPLGFSVASFNDCMVITATSTIKESLVEEYFVKNLTSLGIGVCLECDDEKLFQKEKKDEVL